MPMTIAVPREIRDGERRVAATPETVGQLLKLGFTVNVETEAGVRASFDDDAYRAAGAQIVSDTRALWADADIVIKVRAPEHHPALGVGETTLLKPGATLISFIEAAQHFGRVFTGQITAAGKMPPAKVMVIGAGVAGLAAIGAARGLGAIVRAFDTRPEVEQQVESMGAEFLKLDVEEEGSGAGGYAKQMSAKFIEAEMALFAAQAKEVDIIITTALIPGKPAPKLITAAMVAGMRPGSVIVDMAAEQGGNCELTQPGVVATVKGVTIIGYTDLPSRMATQSSQLYGTNIRHLLTDLTPQKDGIARIDMNDDVMRGATVVYEGQPSWPPPPPKQAAIAVHKPAPAKAAAAAAAGAKEQVRGSRYTSLILLAVAALGLLALGAVAPAAFVAHLTVFVLAVFVGYQVVWNVTPALHTPLMSVTNAISGIIVIGALLQLGTPNVLVTVLGGIALLVATINIAGGFLVTQRMLKMFQRN